MKRKLFIVCLVIGCILLLMSIMGFKYLGDMKKTISEYDGSTNKLFKDVQDHDTYKYYDNYWKYLENHDCTILSSCYCDHVHSEEECINQFLTNGGGSVKAVDSFTYSLIKMRYLSIILAIASFVGAWIFYKKKNDKNKSK